MPRTDDDSWDIATSVGATAVMVALARAVETGSADPLIRDEFADVLVSSPELAGVRDQISAWWTEHPDGDDGDDFTVTAQQMINYQAIRTHFFDRYFAAATSAGIGQHVILAAGLDSRAYRLNWPAGTTVYEIDMPKVLEYKAATLTASGATPSADRHAVPVDLRDDWPKALRDAGFDPGRPTAWLAEGLLPFLPGTAVLDMFAAIDTLSAPASRIAVEVFGFAGPRAEIEQRWAQARAEREARGQSVPFDPFDLWYIEDDRPDVVDWLTGHGWSAKSVDSTEEAGRLGRSAFRTADDEAPFFNALVTAEKER